MALRNAQPGAKLLRLNVVVILVLAFIVTFLIYVDKLEDDIEAVAVDKTITDINTALALTLYQHAVEGRLGDLPLLDGENPFVFLAIYKQLPINYGGTIRADVVEMDDRLWYYNIDTRRVIYRSGGESRRFGVEFRYKDRNHNNRFDAAVDQVSGLVLAEQS